MPGARQHNAPLPAKLQAAAGTGCPSSGKSELKILHHVIKGVIDILKVPS